MTGVEPTVLRVIDVPAVALLPELHDLLQVAIGWTDSHLHQFSAGDVSYGMPDTDAEEDEEEETNVPLQGLPAHFTYLYDFGDGWEHEVDVVGAGSEQPGVVAGEGPCPPEDVGGPYGYAEFRKALADPQHPDHDQMREWAGNWHDTFDLATADLLVKQTVGAVPAPVRLVLQLTADGVKLTPGGRLPRNFVRRVQQHYPGWRRLGDDRPASIEEDLPPLTALHVLMRHVGLLRPRNGVLKPIRAAGDDIEVVRRLRSAFKPDDGFMSLLVTDTVASLAANGPSRPRDLAGHLLDLLGDRWFTDQGEALDVDGTLSQLYFFKPIMVGLDLIEDSNGVWVPGPSARSLLPRATALAHLWSRYSASH